MKRKRTMLGLALAAVATLVMVGLAACSPEEDNTAANTENNGGGSGGDNGGGGNGGGSNVPAGFVDLGLPSGLLWAECNLGATTPEGYGDYYAWGETAPKSIYNWDTYRYGGYCQLTKYCNYSDYGYNGFTDNLTTLEAIDDAATQALGSGARTPTDAEWLELMNNTTATWTTLNGVSGRLFTAPNGNSLFLPAAGYRDGSSLGGAGTVGDYWSSSLDTSYPSYAWYFNFYSGGQCMGNYDRDYGRSVRPVRSAR